MTTSDELVFIPGVGFRPAWSAMLVTPVSAERGEWSVTIERLVTSSEKTELVFALTGPGGAPAYGFEPPEPPPWMRLPVSLRFAGQVLELTNEGRQGPSEWSMGRGTHLRTVRPTLRFPPLSVRTNEIEVVFGEPVGDWAVPVTLTPSTAYGLPAKALDISEAQHGVTLAIRAIARSESMTALDLYATLDPTPQPRFMRSIGVTSRDYEPGQESEFSLVDDMGNQVSQFAIFNDEVARGSELHQVFVFPALHPDASRVTFTIDDVVLVETIGTYTTVPVPFEGDLRFGTFDVRATVKLEETRRGLAVRVALDDGGWHDDRRLLYPETVRVNGRHGGIGIEGRRTGEPCSVTADPQRDAEEVKLESPLVRLHGPWRFATEV